jgi:hypothetical protein
LCNHRRIRSGLHAAGGLIALVMVNFHRSDKFNHSTIQQYPLRSDPDVVLVSLLVTDRCSRINLISDSKAGASAAMASDS